MPINVEETLIDLQNQIDDISFKIGILAILTGLCLGGFIHKLFTL